jgi:hypothetical protein
MVIQQKTYVQIIKECHLVIQLCLLRFEWFGLDLKIDFNSGG